MSLSMRVLLAADPTLPEETRAAIANGDPGSAGKLVALGLNECEAAELLDEPCIAYERGDVAR
jgi:hypothetical protein